MTGSRQWGISLPAAMLLAFVAATVHANEVEGEVEAIDTEALSLTVQGIEFDVDEQTSYDNGLDAFEDISQGQEVEVDFEYTDGRHIATEIELKG